MVWIVEELLSNRSSMGPWVLGFRFKSSSGDIGPFRAIWGYISVPLVGLDCKGALELLSKGFPLCPWSKGASDGEFAERGVYIGRVT